MGRRGYPPEVRQRALELVAAGRSVYQVSLTLSVSVQSIYSWRKQQRDSEIAHEGTAGPITS